MLQLLSVVMNVFVVSFLVMLLISYFFVRRGHKNKMAEFVNSCLFVILNFSLFMIIQFSAVEIGGFGGGFLHVFGFATFAFIVINVLESFKLPNEEEEISSKG